MKKVSIVMRSRNDVEYIERTIESILNQNFQDFELLSFDNASTDGTKEIIAKYPQIKRFDVPEGKYIPGKVLNDAVKECSGEIIVFNNSDAIPQNSDWLGNIIAPIVNDGASAVYGRQTCRPDADILVRKDYEKAFGDTQFSDDFFSMATSAAAASVFKTHPFDDNIKYSEDIYWAKSLRDDGLKISYAPNAISEHSHNYTLEQMRKRFSGEGRADAQIYSSAQSFPSFAKGLLSALVKDFFYILKIGAFKDIFRCARLRIAQKVSYYQSRKIDH